MSLNQNWRRVCHPSIAENCSICINVIILRIIYNLSSMNITGDSSNTSFHWIEKRKSPLYRHAAQQILKWKDTKRNLKNVTSYIALGCSRIIITTFKLPCSIKDAYLNEILAKCILPPQWNYKSLMTQKISEKENREVSNLWSLGQFHNMTYFSLAGFTWMTRASRSCFCGVCSLKYLHLYGSLLRGMKPHFTYMGLQFIVRFE